MTEINDIIGSRKALRPALSYRCPVMCKICYNRKNTDTTLPESAFEKIVSDGTKLNFTDVAFGGGEPLSELPLLKRCIDIAKRYGYNTAITTSGYGLSIKTAQELIESGLDFFQISLGFNRIVFKDTLKLVKKLGCSFGINFLVDKNKIDHLPNIHASLAKMGAMYVVYIIPKAINQGTEYVKFNKSQFLTYIKVLQDIKNTSELPVLIDCGTNAVVSGKCHGTDRGITISPDCKISFCSFCGVWIPLNNSDLKTSIDKLNKRCTGTCLCLAKFLTTN